ncbi:MAG: nidogen-like domain-containing protein [Polyangiales bacterium]
MIARSLRTSTLATAAAAALLSLAAPAEAIPLLNGFGGPTGYGLATNCVHPNDDGSYSGPGGAGAAVAIDLRPAFPGGLNFFGRTYTSFYLNTNGNITFRGALFTYTPNPFPVAEQPMIAPWWGDVDTRGGGQPTRNNICFHIEPNRIVITWNNVGYYSSHNDRLNDFQMVLSTSATCATAGDFDVEFRYNRCEWTTGDASGGTGGFGGTPAQVGFDAGNRMDYVSLPMSRTMAILDVCRSSNVPGGDPGLWRFQIRGGGVAGGCTGAGMDCTVPGQMGACAQGITICSGMGTTCQQVNMPRPRRCNGNDNDCDGNPDDDDSLCPTGQVCDRGSCVDRCQPELGCLTGRTCSARGTCVENACLDVTCPAGQRCAGGACVGVCDGVLCPHGQSCRAGRCVDPCEGITCDPRDVCVNGACVPGCQCRPCAGGQTCQPDGYCVDDGCIGVTCPTGTYGGAATCGGRAPDGPRPGRFRWRVPGRARPSIAVEPRRVTAKKKTAGSGAVDGGLSVTDAAAMADAQCDGGVSSSCSTGYPATRRQRSDARGCRAAAMGLCTSRQAPAAAADR